jgi:hypothetical protein
MGEAARRRMVEVYRWEARLSALGEIVEPAPRKAAA